MTARRKTTDDPAAAPFAPNGFYERLIELRAARPQDFAALSPTTKLALGAYEAAKRRTALLAADDQSVLDAGKSA
ncbi:MAG: hypothetical protein LC742_00045 [Acidobacteria bacterium]|nr:hypothetical protein [Acidobacteriota bacterium]